VKRRPEGAVQVSPGITEQAEGKISGERREKVKNEK